LWWVRLKQMDSCTHHKMESRESGKATSRSGSYAHEAPAPLIVDPVPIGVVVGTHGVRGTLRVRAFGSGRHLREGIEPVVGGARRRISAARETPKGFLVDVEGVGSREDANSLKGEELLIGRGELDPPEEGEFYVADLVGLTAIDDAGQVVGVVSDSFETAAHEVLVVRRGTQEVYVPFTLEHAPNVDLALGQVVIRPPES
jgi:16S rRNA processing protein RimM